MQQFQMKESFIKLIPGLLASSILAMLAIGLSKIIPNVGAATLSIFIGMIAGNSLLKDKKYQKGCKFAESQFLAVSIVLLGATISFSALKGLGVNGIIFIILQMIFTILFAMVIGDRFSMGIKFTALMATGNAVCGSSAIAAMSETIHAKSDDKGLSIAIVNLIGTILMLALPVLTWFMYQHQILQSSGMIGGVLQSIGQVVASGAMVSEEVKEMATLFKLLRVMLLSVVVLFLGNYVQRKTSVNGGKASLKMPWYVIGFIVTCMLFSLGAISPQMAIIFKKISGYLEIIALAAIGLKINVKEILAEGRQALTYGLCIGVFQVICALVLIQILL